MPEVRQSTRTGFVLRDPFPWERLAELVELGEALGYRALFMPEISGGRDPFAALTGLADHARELRLGTGVVPITSRTASLTAMAAATLQERSRGRAILGVGTGPAVPGALDRLRSQVAEIRERFDGGLSLPTRPPPIWISALGPRAVRLAGEVANGVLLNWCTPDRVRRAAAELREGADRAGRDPAQIEVAVYVRGAVGDSAAAALRAAAAEYASYPAYARQFVRMGLDPADPAAIAAAVCLPTSPAAARDRLLRYAAEGADLTLVYPVAGESGVDGVAETLRALAP